MVCAALSMQKYILKDRPLVLGHTHCTAQQDCVCVCGCPGS